MDIKKLPQEFYLQNATEVAPNLLGKLLCRKTEKGFIAGKIVETEAYMGTIDKAAHSYSGKATPRTSAMFAEGGHAYVYLIYGMHYCFNVVTNVKGTPQAVLVRALEPVSGLGIIAENRKVKRKIDYTNGPGKLAQALGITKELNGISLLSDTLFVAESSDNTPFEIENSKRINIDYAEEAKDFLWRYTVKGNPYVSK